MQPIRQLMEVLGNQLDRDYSLFTVDDLQAISPSQGRGAFRAMLSRAEKQGYMERVCRGLYRYPRTGTYGGLLLYHAAAKLRADEFNYISLESALSDAGIISQIPTHWITLMSSGRSHIVDCGHYGHIEFIHTKKQPNAIADQLTYDTNCRLWRASIPLAIRDMKDTGRSLDLIDWEAVNGLI